MLRNMSNDELFRLYSETELPLRLRSYKNVLETRNFLQKFKDYLGSYPPSAQMAKAFLAQFTHWKTNTLRRYVGRLAAFMSWYGEKLDLKIKAPKTLPPHTRGEDVNKLLKAITAKKTHKKTVNRDSLLVELAYKTGLRRGELANLKVRDIRLDERFLIVRAGKNEKDRIIPLTTGIIAKLRSYINNKDDHENLFGLAPATISNKIREFARKAGVDLHAHSLRHAFATGLVERGADVRTVQVLLGHSDLSTTQVYLNFTDQHLRDAIDLLETKPPEVEHNQIIGESAGSEAKGISSNLIDKTEERLHKRQIRAVARKLAEGITLPSYRDKDLWKDLPVEFQPGEHSLPIGTVEIGTDKQMKVNCHDTNAGIAEPHLIRGLYSHLSTSGLPKFIELVGDKGKLTNWTDQVARYLEALLKLIMTITEDIKGYGAKVCFNDEIKPGPTKWLVLTIWNDALQKAEGHSWIEDSWYKTSEHASGPGLYQLKCGAYSIGIADREETLEQYESWHKESRSRYAEHQLAKDIQAMSQELDNIAQDIRRRLREFSDMQHLPGHCELCADA